MTGLTVLLKKEWREQTRNLKILWIPLVFIIFGVIEPLVSYYLPEIMKSVGNMPEGAEFMWPEFQGEDIFVSLIGQYQSIGILVIVLAFIGTISGERKSGLGTLLYVRPISFRAYYMSKWLLINGIVFGSVWSGFLATWYYTNILYGGITFGEVFHLVMIYSLWLFFVVTIVLTCSALFPTGVGGSIAIFLMLGISIIDSLVGQYWTVSPWKLPTYATYAFDGRIEWTNIWWSLSITVVLIGLLVLLGGWAAKRNIAKTLI